MTLSKTYEFSETILYQIKLINFYLFYSLSNQPVRNTFKLFYQDKIVSHATQSLFLESKFLEALQSKITSDDKLPDVSVTSFANYLGAKHLFEITLKGPLRHLANVVSNTTIIEIEMTENIKYKKFIADEKIGKTPTVNPNVIQRISLYLFFIERHLTPSTVLSSSAARLVSIQRQPAAISTTSPSNMRTSSQVPCDLRASLRKSS